MPRPSKGRRVCSLPPCTDFGPQKTGGSDAVVMGIDDYEVLRLIDLEDLTQEACAAQMGVARTTIQAIYASARRKTALCIVRGFRLVIEGGAVCLCDHQGCPCGLGCRYCTQAQDEEKRKGTTR